jgi:hypothetical protein
MRILMAFLLCYGRLLASEIGGTVDFQTLRTETVYLQGNTIKVRGFLFRGDAGQWVLSSEPNLKSCCVGKESKRDKQILLDGQYEEGMINQVVEVEGRFENTSPWRIESARVVSKTGAQGWLRAGLVGLGLVALLGWYLFYFAFSAN